MTASQLIVSPKWLAEHLEDDNIVIVDCRFSLANPKLGQQQYQEGHLPGAFYLDLDQDLSSPIQKHGGRHPLPNPEKLSAKLSEIGITSQQTLVVAYDDSRLAFASRLWWLLRYFGHNQVVLLDGGFSQWKNLDYPISSNIPNPKLGIFKPEIQSEMLVDIETVKARKDSPGVVLIDSREPERYLGKTEPIDPIAGCIPGAVNYPWQEVTETTGFVKINEQSQRWQNIKDSEEIIVYCGSGVTACVNLFSLELAGIDQAKLYGGSWSDWCSYLTEAQKSDHGFKMITQINTD
ncbi:MULTISPECIES: sulfurtransferase [Planktothrix]|uniref:3-mercaptopyruvate sulfurtransferase n=1 Tax=Planktothrix rubescens CCAP 1459/22 TaxID=329571 RepID=A0A6J7ZH09_PLARU|nr:MULTISPECIES: sulfurtransferase [Planktothrix]CAC5340241.1 putative 3-mercaptopyruvate sulfurtransferase [Planktothrix rubescens NIVA-CYA 18]CAD5945141.1 putative 3-mercaptopyruvate sulfurtransferase [Planktothrix rubescens NIVA-CYA 18]CAD5946642.1 putative 3-mercaptopyruvate sulfurtransferase [Planktothrix agardhii]